MSWTWRWLDYSIAIVAVIAGFAIWFLPNFENSPEIKKLYAQQRELKELRLKREAAEAKIKQEQEELGLVFIAPPPVQDPPAAAGKKGQ